MVSIQQATKTVVSQSNFLEDVLAQDVANYSSLARQIKPDVEKILHKKASEHAIIVALKRLEIHYKKKITMKDVFGKIPEITVRSNLTILSVRNSDTLGKKISKLFSLDQEEKKNFFILVEGTSETTIIASTIIYQKISPTLRDEQVLLNISNASAITVALTEELIQLPGIASQFLKIIATHGINILEVASSYLEFTFVVTSNDADKAFSLMKSLFA